MLSFHWFLYADTRWRGVVTYSKSILWFLILNLLTKQLLEMRKSRPPSSYRDDQSSWNVHRILRGSQWLSLTERFGLCKDRHSVYNNARKAMYSKLAFSGNRLTPIIRLARTVYTFNALLYNVCSLRGIYDYISSLLDNDYIKPWVDQVSVFIQLAIPTQKMDAFEKRIQDACDELKIPGAIFIASTADGKWLVKPTLQHKIDKFRQIPVWKGIWSALAQRTLSFDPGFNGLVRIMYKAVSLARFKIIQCGI